MKNRRNFRDFSDSEDKKTEVSSRADRYRIDSEIFANNGTNLNFDQISLEIHTKKLGKIK